MTMSKNIADGECFFQYAKSLDLFDEIIPLGYSMGALVAGRLAVAHQEEVKRFVMMSPAANIQTRAVSGNYFGEPHRQCAVDGMGAGWQNRSKYAGCTERDASGNG